MLRRPKRDRCEWNDCPNYGVVRIETAQELAGSTRALFNTDIRIGVTGVAGPAPQDGVPVGVICIAVDAYPAWSISPKESHEWSRTDQKHRYGRAARLIPDQEGSLSKSRRRRPGGDRLLLASPG